MGSINLKVPFLNFLVITAPSFAIAYQSSTGEALAPNKKCKCTPKKERARLGKMPTLMSREVWQKRKKSLREGFMPIPEADEEEEAAVEEKLDGVMEGTEYLDQVKDGVEKLQREL